MIGRPAWIIIASVIGDAELLRDQARDLLLALLQLGRDRDRQGHAVLERRGAPVLEGGPRGRHRAVDVLGRALRDGAHDLLGGRVDDLDGGLRRGLHPLAADVELARAG